MDNKLSSVSSYSQSLLATPLAVVQQPACDHRFHASHSLAVPCTSSPPFRSCSSFLCLLLPPPFMYLSFSPFSPSSSSFAFLLLPHPLLFSDCPPPCPLLFLFFFFLCFFLLEYNGCRACHETKSEFAEHVSGDCSNLFPPTTSKPSSKSVGHETLPSHANHRMYSCGSLDSVHYCLYNSLQTKNVCKELQTFYKSSFATLSF